jgi:quinoprotein glucose dehydrogenase
MLWEVMLPAGDQATAMTYTAGGRQYLVIAAGGYTDISKRAIT